MLHALVGAALVLHGVGHAVGFWLGVPAWFAATWLLPGVGFLVGAWGFWRHAEWWPIVVAVSAVASLLALALQGGAPRQAPVGSALAFDLVVLAALLVPWSRRFVLGL